MPKDYEAMRDKFMSEGMSSKSAKAKAAKIHNASHPEAPVTRKELPWMKKKSK